MTLSSLGARVSYAGDGATQAFSFPYLFLAESHLTIILIDVDGVETIQTLNAHYAVSGVDNSSGGTVTMVIPPAASETLVIIRQLSFTQPDDYQINGPLPAETLEQGFDRIVMMLQQVSEELNRVFKLSPGNAGTATLPSPSEGAFLGWSPGQLTNLNPTLSAETLTFGSGLDKSGTTVSVSLDGTDPALEFNSGTLRAKVDGVSLQRTSSGLAPKLTFANKTDNYTVTNADLGKMVVMNASNMTIALPSVASVGAGFYFWAQQRSGAVNTTVDPDGSETIDSETTIKLSWSDLGAADPKGVVGGAALIYCDGTQWRTIRMFPPAQEAVMKVAVSKGNFVTPADMHHHPAMPKVIASFYWNGSAVVEDYFYNVASVNRNSVGNWTVNFADNFADTGWAAAIFSAASGDTMDGRTLVLTKAVGSVVLETRKSTNAALIDPDLAITVMIYGTQ